MTLHEIKMWLYDNSFNGHKLKVEMLNNGMVNIIGNPDIRSQDIEEFPFPINKVDGDFIFVNNKTKTFKNLPLEVTGFLDLGSNHFESTETWMTKKVGNYIALKSDYVEFEDANFLYDTEFYQLNLYFVSTKRTMFKDDKIPKEYFPYITKGSQHLHIIEYENFQIMKEKQIILEPIDFEDYFNEYDNLESELEDFSL